MIVADAQWNSGTDTFNIKLPSDFVFYDRSYSHYAYDSVGSTMKIDGNEISSLEGSADPRWQSGQLSPTQLSLDDFHTVSLWLKAPYGGAHACAAIALIYREA
jgi:hypothetical protein